MKKYIFPLVLSLFVSCCCLGSVWGQSPNYHIHVTSIATPSFICRGDSVRLSSWNCFCGVPPYTYNWSPTTGVRYDTARCTYASPSHTTTYTITVTDQNGVSGTASVRVVVDSIHVSITGSNICLGSVGWLTAAVSGSNNVPPYTYSWSPSGGTNATATIVSAGTYTLTVTDSDGCSVTKSDSIKSSTIITLTDSVTSNVLCNGGSDGSAGVSVSGGTPPYTYSWSGGGSNSTKTGMAAGTYTVTLTDGCGATATDSVIITQPPPLIVNADTCLARLLIGDTLVAVGGTPPYTYSWSPPVSSASLLLLTDTTIFTLTVTDAHGCSSTSHATFIPSPFVASSCENLFISVYISDTLDNNCAIELYNPAPYAIVLNNYVLTGTTNGSLFSPPFIVRLSGSIPAFGRYVVANSHADIALTSLANMLTDTLNFKGKDVVELAYIAPTISGVVVKLLDKIGDYTIPPTDSGWAVNSGSTKNHTLSRYVSVVEGDPDWTTCQSQWNVYPQGTFTELGHYENVCYPGDAKLYLQLGDTSLTCGDPSYFNFDILVQADSAKHFNNCTVNIQYAGKNSTEFAGDNFANGGIIVTRGSDFLPDSGNDYHIFDTATNVGDSIMEISLGDASDSSSNGTFVDSIAKVLFHVSLKIQDCQAGTLDTIHISQFSYYTVRDSIKNIKLDSMQKDSITSLFECHCDTCFVHCCGTDSSTYKCLYYCTSNNDTINDGDVCDNVKWYYVYTHDTTFFCHNVAYSNTIWAGNNLPASACHIRIATFNHPINAGTNAKSVAAINTIPDNSSILVIKGTGFGSTPFTIKVSNADKKGMIPLDGTDILSWSENMIKVKMPSVVRGDSNFTPGTGKFTVKNSCEETDSANLQINYSIQNYIDTSYDKLRAEIVMVNNSGGVAESFIWRCDTSISHNPAAFACVRYAIRTWNCWTGVNWKLGSDTTGDTTSKQDGISVIYFTNSFPPLSGNVMFTTPWYLPCYDITDSVAFTDEADIKVRRKLPSGFTWNYDTTSTVFSGNIGYFYDAILHEMGHAHGLRHLNDSFSLMYRTQYVRQRVHINSGVTIPGPATLLGALDMIYTSVLPANSPTSLGCSYPQLDTSTRDCFDATLSVPVISQNINSYNLNVFPNPIHSGSLTIAYQLDNDSYIQFKILDCTGRVVMKLNDEHKPPGDYTEQVNIDALAGGVYLFIANINGECKTIKFIKI